MICLNLARGPERDSAEARIAQERARRRRYSAEWRALHSEAVKQEKRAAYRRLVADPSKRSRMMAQQRNNLAHRRAVNPDFKARDAKYSRDWRQRNKGHHLQSYLSRSYGLSIEEFRAMEAQQRGVCAVCGEPPRNKHGRLYVDHDHATGQVRELLCNHCNTALGHAIDSPDRLLKLVQYLRKHGKG